MSWFKKKQENGLEELADANRTAVQIVTHKNATKDLIKEAKEANDKLQDLLVKNGFTVKIYIAAGGKTKINKSRTTT